MSISMFKECFYDIGIHACIIASVVGTHTECNTYYLDVPEDHE